MHHPKGLVLGPDEQLQSVVEVKSKFVVNAVTNRNGAQRASAVY